MVEVAGPGTPPAGRAGPATGDARGRASRGSLRHSSSAAPSRSRTGADLGVERRDAPPPVGELEDLAGVGRGMARVIGEHRRRVRSRRSRAGIAGPPRDPRHQGGARVTDQAEIGVFGGSGFYSLLDDVREIKVDTPYGPPSDSFFLATVGGRSVAFLPRHGRRHTIPPHRINYRANVWAMRSLGVKAVISPCAAGLAPAPRQARRLRPVRPVRRPDPRPRRHVLRRPDRDPRLVGRHLRPGAAAASPLDVIREHGIPVHETGHDRDHQRPAVLDEGRVEVVQRRRLGGHLDDPVSRGVPLPRARDGGREHRPDHRLRRRRPRGHRGGRRPVGHSRSSPRTPSGSRRSCST